jgi:hypothetical protein
MLIVSREVGRFFGIAFCAVTSLRFFLALIQNYVFDQ